MEGKKGKRVALRDDVFLPLLLFFLLRIVMEFSHKEISHGSFFPMEKYIYVFLKEKLRRKNRSFFYDTLLDFRILKNL